MFTKIHIHKKYKEINVLFKLKSVYKNSHSQKKKKLNPKIHIHKKEFK